MACVCRRFVCSQSTPFLIFRSHHQENNPQCTFPLLCLMCSITNISTLYWWKHCHMISKRFPPSLNFFCSSKFAHVWCSCNLSWPSTISTHKNDFACMWNNHVVFMSSPALRSVVYHMWLWTTIFWENWWNISYFNFCRFELARRGRVILQGLFNNFLISISKKLQNIRNN